VSDWCFYRGGFSEPLRRRSAGAQHVRVRPVDPRLRRYALASRTHLILCVALGVGWAGLVVVQATLLADGLTGAGVLALLAGVTFGRAAIAWAQEVAAHRAAASTRSRLRERLMAQVVRLGPGWVTDERSGELAILATRGIDALEGYFARFLPQLVLAVIVPVVVLARVFPADLVAAVTIVVTLPLIPLFMALVGRGTGEATRRQFRYLERLSHHFLDVVTGLPTLRIFGRARAQAHTIATVTEQYRRLTMRVLRVTFLSGLVLELLATLSVALVAVSIGLRLVGGSLDLRTGLLVLILAPEAYLPLRALGSHYHASVEGLAAAEEVFAVLETEAPARGRVMPDGLPLVLEEVSVSYPGRETPALADFSLRLSPGEVVGLTGPSGAGKSTVLALLLGFVAPTAGRVRVGSVDLSDVDLDAWRARVAWLPQAPYLVAGTVGENIRLARPDASEAAVRAAAASLVDELPNGLATLVGDGGQGVSAGQRQRIALARALLRDAPVLLLDEPTASLDGATEAVVADAVRRAAAGRTVLLVAHRPAMLAVADRVVTLDPPGPPRRHPAAAVVVR
jgi:thiol reductant ABC exporter CydD subunit